MNQPPPIAQSSSATAIPRRAAVLRRVAGDIRLQLQRGRDRREVPSAARGAPHRARKSGRASAFDQPDLARPWALAGFLRRELHALAFAQQLEHRAPDGAAVEEMLDSTFVPNEAVPLIDQEPCDRPGWHSPLSSDVRDPRE